jgi:molybdopterin-containing oxidoreductase family iron-sulfur binding subunit
MNRLYAVEPMPTPTGSKADHRLPLRAHDVAEFAWALATAIGAAQGPKQGANADIFKWTGPIARDLAMHKGESLVIPGDHQPPLVHALAHVINAHLGNIGKTVFYTDPAEAEPVDQLLIILGGNPVFTAPVEMGMRDRIRKARLRIRLGMYEDETSELCQWRLPETHFLETWSDARSFDGTVTIMQPLIQPLFNGRSAQPASGGGFRDMVAQGAS